MSKNTLQNPNPCLGPGTRSPFPNTSLVAPWLWRGLAKVFCNMDYNVNLKDYLKLIARTAIARKTLCFITHHQPLFTFSHR
jgi:hypothetical protein